MKNLKIEERKNKEAEKIIAYFSRQHKTKTKDIKEIKERYNLIKTL